MLPSAIEEKLSQISRRQSAICILRSMAIATSVLIASMIVAMLLDWQLSLFDTLVRTMLTVTALVLASGALLAMAIPPLRSALTQARAATDADAEVPQLEERWQTVVTMSGKGQRSSSPAAMSMLQQVTSEAVAMGQIVQPGRVAHPQALFRSMKSLAGCAFVLAGFLALDWQSTSVLLRRFWSPMSDISATQLRSVTGDVVIPRGESVELVAELTGMPRSSAMLQIIRPDATPDETKNEDLKIATQADRPTAFVQRVRAEESFQYRMRAGDGQTAWHTVTVVEFPALAEVQFTIVPPAYLNRPKYEKNLIPGRVKVMQGSTLQLQVRPKSPVERLELSLAFDADEPGTDAATRQVRSLAANKNGMYHFEMLVTKSLNLGLQMWNSHGLKNEDRPECRIQVLIDNAPVARVLDSNDELAVAADDVIDIKFEAHDDHGITSAELVIYDESSSTDGGPPQILKIVPIPLGDQQNEKHVTGTAQLDLKQFNLEAGKQISYAVRVTDNRMVAVDLPISKPEADAAAFESTDETPRNTLSTEPGLESPADAGPPSRSPDSKLTNSKLANSKLANPKLPDSKSPKSLLASRDQTDSKPDEQSGDGESPADVADQAAKNDEPASDSVADAQSTSPAAPGKRKSYQVAKAGRDPKSQSKDGDAIAGTNPKEQHDVDSNRAEGDSKVAGPTNRDDDAKGEPSSTEQKPIRKSNGPSPVSDTTSDSRQLALAPQQSESGQNAETNRRRLKVTERISARESIQARQQEVTGIRDRVVAIDKLLSAIETDLTRVVKREIPDDERTAQFRRLDADFGNVETMISDLRVETRDEQYAFVGLQMLDIGRSHVTPAREKVFAAIRETTAADSNARGALQQTIRARELLAALLTRYDRVTREEKLSEELELAVKMYEVYVEKSQQLMREARQNRNPLERKMAVLEIGQDYLDRFTEVLTLRREMMAEFGRMLGDDPRLLARYLDLIKRRRTSLRDQLTELAERQQESATELSHWAQADPVQRNDLWALFVELRMQASIPLARDCAELAERIEKQLPLVLEAKGGVSRHVVELGRQIAESSRFISLDARRQIREPGSALDLPQKAEQLARLFGALETALEQLNFEHSQEQEVTAYVTSRLLESRTVADQADTWLEVTEHAQHRRYQGLAEVDQHRLAISTELLRVDMLGIDADLENQFQQIAKTSVPAEIAEQIRELHVLMDEITRLQGSATFACSQDRLQTAELLQGRINTAFAQAQELLDRIRKSVATALDEFDVPNPTVAELQDPTLDAFLTQLEREPNIEAQLGLPERPRNLRIIAETMQWQQTGGELLGDSEQAARSRAKQAMRQEKPRKKPGPSPETSDDQEQEPTEAEQQDREKTEELERNIAMALAAVKERAKRPALSAEEKRKLEQTAANLERLLDEMNQNSKPSEQWNRIAESDQMQAILKALSRGDGIPDEQWNKLFSKLGDGLWQTGGRTLPDDYRKAIEQYQERIRKLMNTEKQNN